MRCSAIRTQGRDVAFYFHMQVQAQRYLSGLTTELPDTPNPHLVPALTTATREGQQVENTSLTKPGELPAGLWGPCFAGI